MFGHRIVVREPDLRDPSVLRDSHGRMVEAFSKPLGALRLTEMFLKSDPANARELARIDLPASGDE